MNYNSENASQKNSMLNSLIQKNSDSIEKLELRPYQPIVYAIPVEQRSEEMNLLKRAAEFQPTLYSMIEKLATWEEIDNRFQEIQNIEAEYMDETVSSLKQENQKTVAKLTSENRETVRFLQENVQQAGKIQEEFISQISKIMDSKTEKLEQVIFHMRRRILQIVIGTSAASVLLSVLVSAVFWKLVQ